MTKKMTLAERIINFKRFHVGTHIGVPFAATSCSTCGFIEVIEAQRNELANQVLAKELRLLQEIINSYADHLLRKTLTNRIRYRLKELGDSKAE